MDLKKGEKRFEDESLAIHNGGLSLIIGIDKILWKKFATLCNTILVCLSEYQYFKGFKFKDSVGPIMACSNKTNKNEYFHG